MKLDNYLIGFLIFSFFIASGTYILADINSNYGLTIDTDDFNDTYNTIDEMYNITDEMRENTIEADIESGEATIDSTVRSSYSAIRFVKDTFKLFGNIINDIAELLGLPGFVITFAMTALLLSVIMAMIFLFLRVRS